MITERQKELLKVIVLEYIKLAHPVSSNIICERLDCSSATVRSEMGRLEELGLLEKTHISSGRIPSEEGYRYYVDNLMEPKEINGEDMLKLQIIFNNRNLQLNDCIKKSLEVISSMTNYTSIVLGHASHENKLKEISVVPVSDTSIIVIVITDQGHVEHKMIDLPNISLEEIKKTVNLINDLIIGTPIDEISVKLEFEIKPIIGRYVKEHEFIYNAFYKVFNDFTNRNIDIVGKHLMIKQPEFNDIDKIKDLFISLDDNQIIDKIETDNNDISIYIGKENKIDKDVTVVQTKYRTNGSEGTIAIIGPKRMDYERVVTLLEYIRENVEEKGDK